MSYNRCKQLHELLQVSSITSVTTGGTAYMRKHHLQQVSQFCFKTADATDGYLLWHCGTQHHQLDQTGCSIGTL